MLFESLALKMIPYQHIDGAISFSLVMVSPPFQRSSNICLFLCQRSVRVTDLCSKSTGTVAQCCRSNR